MAESTKMFRNFMQMVRPLRGLVYEAKARKTITSVKGTYTSLFPARSFKSHSLLLSKEKFTRDPSRIVTADGRIIRKKTAQVKMVNLIEKSNMTVVSFEDAKTTAKARGLNMLKVEVEKNKRSSRETYKLVTDSELSAALSQQEKGKDLKLLTITTAIHEADFQTKVKAMLKFLKKEGQFKVTIKKIGKDDDMKKFFERIAEELKKADVEFSSTIIASKSSVMHFKVVGEIKNPGSKLNVESNENQQIQMDRG